MCAAKVFALKCSVQEYDWGKHGAASEVARLAHGADEDFKVDANTPYAELWMGTHPKGPSTIFSSGELLSDWIKTHAKTLGHKANELTADGVGQLPFLFKVLSVNKSLSIQAHPNKKEAERLHKENPKEYPDDNHKPEMAIALTPFEALCGFRPKTEIAEFLKSVPELRLVVGEENAEELLEGKSDSENSPIKKSFTALMTSDDKTIKEQLAHLVARVQEAKTSGDSEVVVSCHGDLLLRLYDQFPGDVGCFAIYFFNFITLKAGEALFLEANLPHAYLYGDCLECMACSDNVVRAGLTPKFKDVPTLCSLLNYDSKTPSDLLFKGSKISDDPLVTLFDPPVPDFTVHQIQIPSTVDEHIIRPLDGASILIVIKGNADATSQSLGNEVLEVKDGSVLYISAHEAVTLKMKSPNKETLVYRATC